MVTYTLAISVQNDWVKYFNNNGWKFCFARKTESLGSSQSMNVIAYAEDVGETMVVEWQDEYAIAGSKSGFSAGAKITIGSRPEDIDFGQKCSMNKDWSHPQVEDSDDAPPQGFLYITEPQSACILYQRVLGKFTPIYITPEALLPPNTSEELVPKIEVAVWFSRKAETSSMLDVAKQKPFTIPMATESASIEYNKAGQWRYTTESMNYVLIEDDEPYSQAQLGINTVPAIKTSA